MPLRAVSLDNIGYYGKICTITDMLLSGTKVGVKFKPAHTVFMLKESLALIHADRSVPNGTEIIDCHVRVIKTTGECWINRKKALGHVFEVCSMDKNGLTLACIDEKFGDVYWITHGCYEVCPNYIEDVWYVNDSSEVVKGSLVFTDYNGRDIIWTDVDDYQVNDSLVRKDFTDALDLARKFTDKPIKIVK